jgi:predicted amidohydrolase YtcJ
VPAAFYGQSRETGTLTPGKRADVTVLDRDIFRVDPQEIAHSRVEMTIFDGRIVHRSD